MLIMYKNQYTQLRCLICHIRLSRVSPERRESECCRGRWGCSGWLPGAEHSWGAGHWKHDGGVRVRHLQRRGLCWKAVPWAAGSRWGMFKRFLYNLPWLHTKNLHYICINNIYSFGTFPLNRLTEASAFVYPYRFIFFELNSLQMHDFKINSLQHRL